MANRVSVNINVNDLSRGGIRSVHRSLANLRRQLPDDHTIVVNLNDDNALFRAGRLRRAIRRLPDDVTVRVNTIGPDRAHRNRMVTSLQRSLTSPFRVMGRALGGILSDGLGQGIIGAFQAAGPVGMAVLAAIIVGALSVIGAALSGLLVTALGLAFVAIGGISAARSKEVKKTWSEALESLKKDFAEVGEPMIPVLERAIGKIQEMAHTATPMLKAALEQTTTATNSFVDLLLEGFKSFGKAAFGPIMDAWNVFAPVFGSEWNEFMDELGNSFGRMADLVREHPTEIAAALDIVFEAIDLLVDTVTFFGKVWVWAMHDVADGMAFVMKVLTAFVDGFLGGLELILVGAEKSFGWIPGIGGKLKSARESFASWREDIVGDLEAATNKVSSYSENLDKANRKRKLEADISSFTDQLRVARDDLKKTSSTKAKAKLKADISDLKSKVSAAWQELAKIDGKNAVAYITTYSNTYRSVHDIVGKATGGIRGAASGGARGNMTLVGEHGPELVNLPPGSHVRSNPDSRRLAGMGGNGDGPTLVLQSSGALVDDLLMDLLQRAVKVRGGNVQVAIMGRE